MVTGSKYVDNQSTNEVSVHPVENGIADGADAEEVPVSNGNHDDDAYVAAEGIAEVKENGCEEDVATNGFSENGLEEEEEEEEGKLTTVVCFVMDCVRLFYACPESLSVE